MGNNRDKRAKGPRDKRISGANRARKQRLRGRFFGIARRNKSGRASGRASPRSSGLPRTPFRLPWRAVVSGEGHPPSTTANQSEMTERRTSSRDLLKTRLSESCNRSRGENAKNAVFSMFGSEKIIAKELIPALTPRKPRKKLQNHPVNGYRISKV